MKVFISLCDMSLLNSGWMKCWLGLRMQWNYLDRNIAFLLLISVIEPIFIKNNRDKHAPRKCLEMPSLTYADHSKTHSNASITVELCDFCMNKGTVTNKRKFSKNDNYCFWTTWFQKIVHERKTNFVFATRKRTNKRAHYS